MKRQQFEIMLNYLCKHWDPYGFETNLQMVRD